MKQTSKNTYLYDIAEIREALLQRLKQAQGDETQAIKMMEEAESLADILSLTEARGCVVHHDCAYVMPCLWWLRCYADMGRDEAPMMLDQKISDIVGEDPSLKKLTELVECAYQQRHALMEKGRDPMAEFIFAEKQRRVLKKVASHAGNIFLKRRL